MPRGRTSKRQDDVLLRSADMIGWAIGGIEREIAQTRERLASLTAQATRLRAKLGARGAVFVSGAASAADSGTGGRVRKRRRMSPEARKRISEMMKKRWAERRKKG